jgi:citrate synthase
LINKVNIKMDWLTSGEALALLGTQPQTLYANVSRGRILARRDPGDSRRSLYSGEDVRRLAQKHAGRPRSEAVAADTIRWGDPILPSAISTVVDGRLYYRGRDAAVLAKSASLEETAAILWEIADPGNWPMAHAGTGTPVERLFAMLARRAATDLPTSGRAASLLKREAGGVFAAVLDALAGEGEGPAHRRLAGSWDRSHAADTLRTALVLLADHELNASTFAARVAASTGASLSASVLAGLSALTGPLHGGAAREVAAFLQAGEEQDAAIAVRNWLGPPALSGRRYPGHDAIRAFRGSAAGCRSLSGRRRVVR